jgi:hypothetical protein
VALIFPKEAFLFGQTMDFGKKLIRSSEIFPKEMAAKFDKK